MSSPGNIVQTIVTEVEQLAIGIIEKLLSGGVIAGEKADELRSSLDEFKSRRHGR
jgi:hypothetical protein